MPLPLFFFLRMALAIWRLWGFFFFSSVKNAFGILVGIGLNLRSALGNTDRNQTLRVVLDYLCLPDCAENSLCGIIQLSGLLALLWFQQPPCFKAEEIETWNSWVPLNSHVILIYGMTDSWTFSSLGGKPEVPWQSRGSLHSVGGLPHPDTITICWPLGPWTFEIFHYLRCSSVSGSRCWLRALPLVRPLRRQCFLMWKPHLSKYHLLGVQTHQ